MDDFINTIKNDPQVRIKINYMSDRNNRLLYIYHSKIGYDALIQIVIHKEMINTMRTMVVDIDIELNILKVNFYDYVILFKTIDYDVCHRM